MSHDCHLVVFSGAGVSADSGIATFRGAGGLWENHSIDEVCNYDTWERNRERVRRFYNVRRIALSGVEPNPSFRRPGGQDRAVPIPIHSEPEWLEAWLSGRMSRREALQHFNSLSGVNPNELVGLWRGRTLPTGHPLDGLLELLDWYGKEVLPGGRVYPLLFRQASGRIVALDPAWMPAGVALQWPALAHSPPTRAAFQALGPVLRARGPSARIEVREHRGRPRAAIVYDRQPIVDHLRSLGAGRLVGLMERRGMAAPYFFLLWREGTAAAPPAGFYRH